MNRAELNLGDTVKWTSQAGGHVVTKIGTVVFKGASSRHLYGAIQQREAWLDDESRSHANMYALEGDAVREGILVFVHRLVRPQPDGSEKVQELKRKRIYAPRVSLLERTLPSSEEVHRRRQAADLQTRGSTL